MQICHSARNYIAMAGSSAVAGSGAAKGRFTLGLSRLMELGLIEEGEVLFYKVVCASSSAPTPACTRFSLGTSLDGSAGSAQRLLAMRARRKAKFALSVPRPRPASRRRAMTSHWGCPPSRPCQAAQCGGLRPTFGRPRARRSSTSSTPRRDERPSQSAQKPALMLRILCCMSRQLQAAAKRW